MSIGAPGSVTARPRVSIAVPVFNAAASIRAALDSALGQTCEDLEIVVCDNASTDGTAEIVREYSDPRIRLHVNAENLGYQRNNNLSIIRTQGEFVKFLHADDLLFPRCVERMLEPFASSERIGLVFSRRRVDIPSESEPTLLAWRKEHAVPHTRFPELTELNDGRRLLGDYLRAGLTENWVGEPVAVMMRRAALERLGLFHSRMQVFDDVEMWARTMAIYDIGFIDEELAAYRYAPGNLTHALKPKRRDWLEYLWLLEGLARVGADVPGLRAALTAERRFVPRRIVRIAKRRPSLLPLLLADLRRYLGWRLREATGAAAPLHPPLAPLS